MMKKSIKFIGSAFVASICFSVLSGAAIADHHGKAAIEAAVANDARPAEEKARDAGRKPAEVLSFAGVEPGMTVLDINSAGGYYPTLLGQKVRFMLIMARFTGILSKPTLASAMTAGWTMLYFSTPIPKPSICPKAALIWRSWCWRITTFILSTRRGQSLRQM